MATGNTIREQVNSISASKQAIIDVLVAKGVQVPAGTKLEGLAALVDKLIMGKTYTETVNSTKWGSLVSGEYKYQITADTHGCGVNPIVLTYDESTNQQTYDSPMIDSSGNVTLYSTINTNLKVVIKS